MKTITVSLFAFVLSALTYGSDASAAVSCTSCVSDGGLGYEWTCCETRVDEAGDSYEYCRTLSCLPGGDVPDKLREGEAPGFTRPHHVKYPDANPVIKFHLGPAITQPEKQ